MPSSVSFLNGLLGMSTALIAYQLVLNGAGSQLRDYLAKKEVVVADTSAADLLNATRLGHCQKASYRTELLSLDPLIIYIQDFLSPVEIEAMLEVGNGLYEESTVSDDPVEGRYQSKSRTSSTAFLPKSAPVVQCILGRSQEFLGFYDFDEIEAPQLTRYKVGQEYQAHFDWPPQPWRESSHNNQRFDRFATFFVYLEANCTGGSTHFPRVSTEGIPHPDDLNTTKYEVLPAAEEGYHHTDSLAVKPIAGNAVFWVNMQGVADGHPKTKHAGMPVIDGSKIGLNIWTRRYMPDDDEEEGVKSAVA